jgi:uncharacterized protein DUF4349
MRLITGFLLALTLVALAGCTGDMKTSRKAEPAAAIDKAKTDNESNERNAHAGSYAHQPLTQGGGGGGGMQGRARAATASDASTISLASISTVYAATEAIDRKIIRNGELTLETDSPTEGLRKITAAAESHGGFVVTSEFKQNPVAAGAKPSQTVVVIARVPATRFASALEQIRSAGERVIQERVSGQDVSEEYLDLEARIRTKKALEAQFLEIMKQARKVEDALQVQSELADVRTEIEGFEGRRRFLENQAALSTITTTLQMPQPMVAATTSGFGASVKRTFGDAIDTTASIVLFMIQALIVLSPIAVFFGLPGWLVWRLLRRRMLVRKPEPSPIPND